LKNLQADGHEERELKLIGLRVDEALDLLEPFLDTASLGGMREVRIIHGMGTGRLRNAVREHLVRHPLVEEFRPGNEHELRTARSASSCSTPAPTVCGPGRAC
jgi:DNA mismatch repair protein MutS2